MALIEKVEAVVDTKLSADMFFNFLHSQTHAWPDVFSDKVKAVDVHEGDGKTSGSIKLWKYTVEGKEEEFKEKVDIDTQNKVMTLTALEGHVLSEYKTYKIIFQVFQKSEVGSVKITLDYEKLHQDIPAPNKYLSVLVNLIEDMDSHLLKA